MDLGYLVGIWPDWELYKQGPVQQSNFIRTYIYDQYRNPDWPHLYCDFFFLDPQGHFHYIPLQKSNLLSPVNAIDPLGS